MRDTSRRWHPLLRKTKSILADPYRAGIRREELAEDIGPFMTWAIDLIDKC